MQEEGKLRAEYKGVRNEFFNLAQQTSDLIDAVCDSSDIHQISHRVKDEDSFVKKALKIDQDGNLKYNDAISQITDIAGVRVISFTRSQADAICEKIESEFEILERLDKGKELISVGKVGYESRHFLIKFSQERCKLPEYRMLKGLVCEVQVRTVFQHAWAEVEHRLQYKQSEARPELKARFQALAGLMQIADREFEQLFDLDRELQKKLLESSRAVQEMADEQLSEEEEGFDYGHALSNAAYRYGYSAKELMEDGEYEKAIDTYRGLISVQPGQVWHKVGLARALLVAGKFDECQTLIDQITEMGSANSRVKDSTKALRKSLKAETGR